MKTLWMEDKNDSQKTLLERKMHVIIMDIATSALVYTNYGKKNGY